MNLTAAGVYSLNIGGPCRIESLDTYMVCWGTPRNDETEQFVVFPAASTANSGTVLVPGSKTILKSVRTGKFCRVVDVGGLQQVACDLDNPANATALTFTGTTFTYGSVPLTNPYGDNVSSQWQAQCRECPAHACSQACNR